MSVRWLVVAGALGCGAAGPAGPGPKDTGHTGQTVDTPSPDPDTGTPPAETGATAPPVETGTWPSIPDTGTWPSTVSATCELGQNTLRQWCEIDVFPPQAVEISWVPADGSQPLRTLRSEDVRQHHGVLLTVMPPETAHDFEVRATRDASAVFSGSFTSGSLPPAAAVQFTVTGTSTSPMFLVPSPCVGAQMLIIDSRGVVLWYEFMSQAPNATVLGAAWTEDGTVVALYSDFAAGLNAVYEVDLAGTGLLHLRRGVDFENPAHHDVFRRDGLTYVLFNEVVPAAGHQYNLDGFYVFDASGGLVRTWRLIDHFTPVSFDPGGGDIDDYSHANSIWLDAAGDIYLSFRHLSAVAKLRGGLAAPDFGDILWRLSGDPDDTDFGNDFTLTASVGDDPTFVRQHNAHLIAPDHLALFDNKFALGDASRVITVRLDTQAWTADIDGAYSLGRHCDFQGGALYTPAGNPVGTCAPTGHAYEFEAGDYESPPSYEIVTTCPLVGNAYIPRYIPLDFVDPP